MSFIEERLLDKVAYGTQSGPEYSTKIVTLRSGVERRARLWTRPLTRFSVIYNALRAEDRAHVVRAFRVCAGRFYGFRMRDPLDYEAVNEPLGPATGVEQTVQLSKSYDFGPIIEVGPVYKPVSAQLFADGAPLSATVDMATGLATFTATEGAVITWSGVFDKPVRFDDDALLWSLDARSGAFAERIVSTDVPLTEIRL